MKTLKQIAHFTRMWVSFNYRKSIWEKQVITTLLTYVISPDEPYYYDSAFSFLQTESFLTNPTRISLFLPDFPLAIDTMYTEGRPNYLEARQHISKKRWDYLQAQLSTKAEKLSAYSCPYLIILDSDPTDPSSLREKIRTMTGRV